MPLYSLESSNAIKRIAGKIAAVDASYLIELSVANTPLHSVVKKFHQDALDNETQFLINVVAQLEFINYIRLIAVREAISQLAMNDSDIKAQYQRLNNVPSNITASTLFGSAACDEIFKFHVRHGNTAILTSMITTDAWSEARRILFETHISYSTKEDSVSWDDLGLRMAQTGLKAPDCMIVSFAASINADAIMTKDVDFAQAAGDFDVYMPLAIARNCAYFNPELD